MLRMNIFKSFWLLLVISTVFQFSLASAKNGDLNGWEIGSEYNQLYNPKERDQIKGDIVKFIAVIPLPGMAPGTALILDEGDGNKVGSSSFQVDLIMLPTGEAIK